MYNLRVQTEELLQELFDIQKMLSNAELSQESKETIADIGVTAYNNYMEANYGSIQRKETARVRNSNY